MILDSLVEKLPSKTGIENFKRVVKKFPSIKEGLGYLKKEDKNEPLSIGSFIEKNAIENPYGKALLFENKIYNHKEFNQKVNQYANFLLSQDVKKGDVVAVFLDNRPEILFAVGAIAKIGAIAALINTNQRKKVLVHSFTLCNPKKAIIGEELLDSYKEIKADVELTDKDILFVEDTGLKKCPKNSIDLEKETATASTLNPGTTQRVLLKDPCFYIYTSGTTGLPKAAIMTHFRWVKAAGAFGMLSLDLTPDDVMYVSLPFYHNNALTVAWGSASGRGAAVAIRRKFSASKFWEDTRKFNATAFCYIGELCRYLMNQPERVDDAHNPVTKIIGNGLRPDIWKEFKERFDITEVYEFYAASEGNIAFVNLLNRDCTVGLCPAPYKLVKYDIENDEIVRDINGNLIEVGKGETGLLIGEVSKKYAFDGYTDKSANEKKLIRNAFKDGDTWFNSGDLLKDMGFRHAQFVDRIGDTFRWKSENVSTTEVAEIMNGFNGINETTVYGVEIPGTEGRACMAAVVLGIEVKDFDFDGFYRFIHQEMPAYAVPLFIRFKSELEITGTFKQKKGDLKKEGFDPAKVDEDLYVLLPKSGKYQSLTDDIFKQIQDQKIAF